jgi:predicted NUDIX family NTP pyrophosphohydrolase
MTLYYKTSTWSSQPQISEDQIAFWKHIADKKNWRIVQLPNGYYQTEYKDQEDKWQDVTRRETLESAEAAIDGSIEHYGSKNL